MFYVFMYLIVISEQFKKRIQNLIKKDSYIKKKLYEITRNIILYLNWHKYHMFL